MLDWLMPLLAHVLTPLFAFGMVGAATVVVVKVAQDVLEFLAGEETDA